MKSQSMEHARKQVNTDTPEAIIEIIAAQMDRKEDAANRIETEGIVVRDMRGSVIPHPAIKIEIEAGKIIADLCKKHCAGNENGW